jgi:hypothetical protein
MLAVLAHTPVPGGHVAALLAVLLEARRHGRRCSPPPPRSYLGGVGGGVEAGRCLGGNPSGWGMVRPYKVGAWGGGRRMRGRGARAIGFGPLGFCFFVRP